MIQWGFGSAEKHQLLSGIFSAFFSARWVKDPLAWNRINAIRFTSLRWRRFNSDNVPESCMSTIMSVSALSPYRVMPIDVKCSRLVLDALS